MSNPIRSTDPLRDPVSCGIRMTRLSAAPELSYAMYSVLWVLRTVDRYQRRCTSHVHDVKHRDLSAFAAFCFDMASCIVVYGQGIMLTVWTLEESRLLIDNRLTRAPDLGIQIWRRLLYSDI